MRVEKVGDLGVFFYLTEEGDSFATALKWVRENCKASRWSFHDDVAKRRGCWEWENYGHKFNHPYEATDSGHFYTTDLDEATQFMLSSGQWTDLPFEFFK